MINKQKEKLLNNGYVYLRIKVRPSAKKTSIVKIMNDKTLKIDIIAPPVKGKANNELVKFLAKEFRTKKESIKIISGAGSNIKLIKIVS